MKRKILLGIIAVIIYTSFTANINNQFYEKNILNQAIKEDPDFLKIPGYWADSVFNQLSPDERIAQLFMVAAYSNRDEAHKAELTQLIEEHHIGGLIFFQGGPVRQAHLTNELQTISKVPLLIGMDAEWGLSMRLDSVVGYPRQMTLGALPNDSLIFNMGKDIAQQCKRLGVHVNFAPVVDVNNNPNNPVINSRSFGETVENVSLKSLAYMRGLQSERVIATAKHFPGHGDTDVDSHKALPTISHNKNRLDSLELFPFKQLIQRGLASVMVAHLNIPSLDSTPNKASTLSPFVVDTLLKQQLGFNGLVFTDALNMKGVSAFYEPGQVDLEALLAGNDVLLFPEDVPLAIEKIKAAIQTGKITQAAIDERCLKLLKAKEWVGLNSLKPIAIEDIVEDLNQLSSTIRYRNMVKQSLTLVKNNPKLLPIPRSRNKVAVVNINSSEKSPFIATLKKYRTWDVFNISEETSIQQINVLPRKLKEYNRVIIAVHGMSQYPQKDYGISKSTQAVVKVLSNNLSTALVLFGNPYGLSKLEQYSKVNSIVVTYQDNELTQELTAQAIMGALPFSGRLPIGTNTFKVGTGIQTQAIQLGYSLPEEQGMNSKVLGKIDSLLALGIDEQAYPGCQVLVARNGQIVYQKNVGYQTYAKTNSVSHNDVYDLASITKIFASTLSLMKLEEMGLFSLEDRLSDYFTLPDTSRYKELTFKEMLSHQAGLVGWIPFYLHTTTSEELFEKWFKHTKNNSFSNLVANDLYSASFARDSIFHMILSQEVDDRKEYKYSDIGYYFIKEIIETIARQPLNEFVQEQFYNRLDLSTMGYHPRERLPLQRIVPTEYDQVFRKQLVHGYVHDPGAAMLGGVGGHAGLFANAYDAAYLMQLFLNGGEIGGTRLLKQKTIDKYTRCQFCDVSDNRRGAGFDKPVMDGTPGPTCDCVSYNSFGHSGFTGTLVWADPDEEIVYVFLSNRIHPSSDNLKLITLNLRTDIQAVIYEAIEERYSLQQSVLTNQG